jgi:multiple sugar transport system permease protein
MAARKSARHNILSGAMIAVTVIWLSPMIFLLMNTLKNAADYSRGPLLLPTTFNLWHNITNAWAQGIQGGFINSLLYGAVSSLLAVLIASLAAFGIVRLKMPRALAWFLFIYSGTIFPLQMYLIPLFKSYIALGIYDTKLGLFCFYTAICIPFATFVMRGFFLTVPWDIQEAAEIEGATSWDVFWRIMMPLAKAPFLMLTLVQFTWVWNDLLFGMILVRSPEARSVQVALLGMQSLYGQADAPTIITATLIVSLPTLLLFLLLQKHFVRGLALGTTG